jgi:hypothetical protein
MTIRRGKKKGQQAAKVRDHVRDELERLERAHVRASGRSRRCTSGCTNF